MLRAHERGSKVFTSEQAQCGLYLNEILLSLLAKEAANSREPSDR